MRRPRPVAALGLAAVVGLSGWAGLASCSDDGDSGAFCERLGDTDQLGDVLGQLDTSDPAGVEEALQQTLTQFQELEGDAPGDIRDDIARIRQGVELVLEAVEDNPDDLPAVREAIAGEIDQLSGLAQAGEAVEAYARDECGIDLGSTATTEATTTEATTTEATTTTEG